MTDWLQETADGRLIVATDGRLLMVDDRYGAPLFQGQAKRCCPCPPPPPPPPPRPPPYPGWSACGEIEVDRAYLWGAPLAGYYALLTIPPFTAPCDDPFGEPHPAGLSTDWASSQSIVDPAFPGFYAPYQRTPCALFEDCFNHVRNSFYEVAFTPAWRRACNPTLPFYWEWGCATSTQNIAELGVVAGEGYVRVVCRVPYAYAAQLEPPHFPIKFRYFPELSAVGVPGDYEYEAFIPLSTGYTNLARVSRKIWGSWPGAGFPDPLSGPYYRVVGCDLVLTRM